MTRVAMLSRLAERFGPDLFITTRTDMFEEFPKIPRLNREVIITEKIDGTNAQILIRDPSEGYSEAEIAGDRIAMATLDGKIYDIFAGSRNRFLRRGDDNFGFAYWVEQNAAELVKLGPGRHYGEWWGKGIQRGYGLTGKRFSLFNTYRWADDAVRPACCHVVPVLAQGLGADQLAMLALNKLRNTGSLAAPGFMKPEGIIVFHTAANSCFKATLDKDEEPKSKRAA